MFENIPCNVVIALAIQNLPSCNAWNAFKRFDHFRNSFMKYEKHSKHQNAIAALWWCGEIKPWLKSSWFVCSVFAPPLLVLSHICGITQNTFVRIPIFIAAETDYCLVLSLTNQLTHWHCWDFIDRGLNSKLVHIVDGLGFGGEERVGNSLRFRIFATIRIVCSQLKGCCAVASCPCSSSCFCNSTQPSSLKCLWHYLK